MKAVPGNCEWNNNTVRDILHRQEYLGHTVLRKTIATNFKTDKRRFSTDDEKLVFENTHEPIVTEELWNKAHSRLIHRTSRHSHEEIMKGCLLAGYVYCFDCGRKLALESHYYKNGGRYYSYRCPGLYRKRSKCTNHYISENSLSQLILHALQRITARIIEDEEGFSNLLKEGWQKQKAQAPVQNKRELLAAEKRFEELDTLISSLYENFVSGILPERQYVSLMKKYDDEQSELDTKIKRMQEDLAEVKVSTIDARRFIEVIKKYKEPKELTRNMVEELIDKIVVHDSVGKKLNREQQIDVYFNFIGQLELPFSQAELRAEKKKQEKLEAQKKASQKKRNKEYQKRQKAIRYANNEGHKFAKKICAHCGKEFWPQGNMAKYCSKECLKEVSANRIKAKRQAYKGDHPFGQKKCRRCGTPFWPVNGQEVLCSEECKKANRKERQLAYYHEHYSPQKNVSTLKAV